MWLALPQLRCPAHMTRRAPHAQRPPVCGERPREALRMACQGGEGLLQSCSLHFLPLDCRWRWATGQGVAVALHLQWSPYESSSKNTCVLRKQTPSQGLNPPSCMVVSPTVCAAAPPARNAQRRPAQAPRTQQAPAWRRQAARRTASLPAPSLFDEVHTLPLCAQLVLPALQCRQPRTKRKLQPSC